MLQTAARLLHVAHLAFSSAQTWYACLPSERVSNRDRLVVSCRVFFFHSDDKVFGTLDGAKNAIGSCSSRRDPDANVSVRRVWYDLKNKISLEVIITSQAKSRLTSPSMMTGFPDERYFTHSLSPGMIAPYL